MKFMKRISCFLKKTMTGSILIHSNMAKLDWSTSKSKRLRLILRISKTGNLRNSKIRKFQMKGLTFLRNQGRGSSSLVIQMMMSNTWRNNRINLKNRLLQEKN
jgi:hypothetical protein